jgi:hypothetical protein
VALHSLLANHISGRSGLGLEAQQAAIAAFAKAHHYKIVESFSEVETGKGADALDRRPKLAAAIKAARKLGKGRTGHRRLAQK